MLRGELGYDPTQLYLVVVQPGQIHTHVMEFLFEESEQKHGGGGGVVVVVVVVVVVCVVVVVVVVVVVGDDADDDCSTPHPLCSSFVQS